MDNIEIKRTSNKKSMESLLQESAIDNQFNYEAQQIRQAYNKTIKDLNIKIKQHEKQIQKLQLEIKQKNQQLGEYQILLEDNEEKMGRIYAQNMELKKSNTMLGRRLSQVEYKLETIEKNRKNVPQIQQDNENEEMEQRILGMKNNVKKQVYKEIAEILNIKVGKFVKEIKSYPMTFELQQSIEAFLQEIIYINSNQTKHNLFETKGRESDQKQRKIGKISARRNYRETQKISDMQQWKQMEKSLNKLKKAGGIHSNSPIPKKLEYTQNTQSKNKQQFSTMSTKPILNYI